MKATCFALGALMILSNAAFGQTNQQRYAGTYRDGFSGFSVTTLQLNEDGSFTLTTVNDTNRNYKTTGVWTTEDDVVVLNPGMVPLEVTATLNESVQGNQDSTTITVKITALRYKGETLKGEEALDPEMLTIFVDDKKHYYNIVRRETKRICLLAPKIKHQVVLQSGNTITIPGSGVERVGINASGFAMPIWFDVKDSKSNYLEINVRLPIDEDRVPRSKKVIIKNDKAYYYEYNGKVDKGLAPLEKQPAGQ